ncbi:hypothetical protein ACO0OL_003959 [Hanseniaspora opuntiae]
MLLSKKIFKFSQTRLYSTLTSKDSLVYGIREKKAISLSNLDDVDINSKTHVKDNLFKNLAITSVVKSCMLNLIKADTTIKNIDTDEIKCSDIQRLSIPKIIQKNDTPVLRNFLDLVKKEHEISKLNKLEDNTASNLVSDPQTEHVNTAQYYNLLSGIVKPAYPVNIHEDKIDVDIFSIGAETGSGKTVAFLTPLLEYLVLYRSKFNNEKNSSPIVRSVIFLPTNELVNQTYDFLMKNGTPVHLNIKKFDVQVTPSQMISSLRESVEDPIDVVICTPEKLTKSLKNINPSYYSHLTNRVEYCVLDETDILLDKNGSLDGLNGFLKDCKNLNTVINCSGTITDNYLNNLKELDIIKRANENNRHQIIITKNLHKINNNINYYNIDCSIGALNNSRLKALGQIIFSIYKKNKRDYTNDPYFMKIFNRIMVFANTKESVLETEEYLRKLLPNANIQILIKETSVEDRKRILHPYLNYSSRDEVFNKEKSNPIPKVLKNFEWIPDSNIKTPIIFSSDTVFSEDIFINRKQDINILITTDILSRGINFKKLKNLILMEPPKNVLSFIHRIGRVCRYGDTGNVNYLSNIKAYNNNAVEKNASVYMITDLDDTKHNWVRNIKKAITFKKKFI